MKTTAIIVLISLSHFSLFGQSIDSLILGTWKWTEKDENTVILKRTDQFKNYPMSLSVQNTDTLYRSMRASVCGNTPLRNKYKIRRGRWQFDSNGLFVIRYEDSPIEFVTPFTERFEVIDSKKNKITLKRVKRIETKLVDQE